MSINKEQAVHLAETLRIVALAQFGFFGYTALKHVDKHWFILLWCSVWFVYLELCAVFLLGGRREH